jgi:hypothetical protein
MTRLRLKVGNKGGVCRRFVKSPPAAQSSWHDPGAPPHRPHIGGGPSSDPFDDPCAAKTLSALTACFDPQLGQVILTESSFIERTSFSKLLPQPLQVYS